MESRFAAFGHCFGRCGCCCYYYCCVMLFFCRSNPSMFTFVILADFFRRICVPFNLFTANLCCDALKCLFRSVSFVLLTADIQHLINDDDDFQCCAQLKTNAKMRTYGRETTVHFAHDKHNFSMFYRVISFLASSAFCQQHDLTSVRQPISNQCFIASIKPANHTYKQCVMRNAQWCSLFNWFISVWD